MTELRASIFIDQLQPQTLAYISTWMRGSLPRSRMSAQIIEIAPGLDIEAITDVVLKSAEVRAGLLVVERQFGTLQFHSFSSSEVHAAESAVLDMIGSDNINTPQPEILASRLVTRLEEQHAFLINRNRLGSLIIGGESLYLLECKPAAYALLATNEAEKYADIKVVDVRLIGASGRVYLSGTEGDIRQAKEAAEEALLQVGASFNE